MRLVPRAPGRVRSRVAQPGDEGDHRVRRHLATLAAVGRGAGLVAERVEGADGAGVVAAEDAVVVARLLEAGEAGGRLEAGLAGVRARVRGGAVASCIHLSFVREEEVVSTGFAPILTSLICKEKISE